MPFINTLLGFFSTTRLKEISQFESFSDVIQNNQLDNLIETAKNTLIGKEYNFSNIRSYEQFRTIVPVRSYEDFSPYIDKMLQGEKNVCWPGQIKWFAKSSGTTNAKSKFIPVTSEALQECHYRGAKDVLISYLHRNPDSKLFQGKCLTLGGSKKISDIGNGMQTGDLSAILIDNAPFYSKFAKTPSPDIALLSKWEEKLEKISKVTVNENITSLAGVPSWLMILLQHILKLSNKTDLHEIWPNLELFMHGGVNFTPYRQQYKNITSKGLNFLETYNASEGFFAFQNDPEEEGMLLMLDSGIFYEFIPLSDIDNPYPKAYSVAEVELGVDYAMVISTNGGLWRYMIGDTVRFTSLRPPKIIISGRTKNFINAFGEELMIDNAERALNEACKATQAEIKEYTGAPVFMSGSAKGYHQWLIEFSKAPSDINLFTDVFDKSLQRLNSDYEAKRKNNFTLEAPLITVARKNLFFDWLDSKDKLGGQNKVPRLFNNREYIDSILELNK